MIVQSFITFKWQEKKLSMIKIFKCFVSDHLDGVSQVEVFLMEFLKSKGNIFLVITGNETTEQNKNNKISPK